MSRPATLTAPLSAPGFAQLQAPAGWQCVEFISDLHLQAAEQATFNAWQHYLQHTAADAVFILGDLFELWVGDDVLAQPASFEARCVQVLADAARQRPLFFMQGNRDFLVGPACLAQAHTTLLSDPTVLVFGGQRWLLSHGDALCLADTDYQQFRAEVRSTAWQQAFLARPLAERQQIGRAIRTQSEARKQGGHDQGQGHSDDGTQADYADLDTPETRHWLQQANAATLVHGHTHRPADHALGDGLARVVLSDWDLAATPPRAEVLRLTLPADGSTVPALTRTRLA